MNIVYNRGSSTTILLDNDITAMTGAQQNPATGRTLHGEPTRRTDFRALPRARRGARLHGEPARHGADGGGAAAGSGAPEPSVIITKAPCALLPEHRRKKRPVYEVIADLCTGCKACSRLGCPAIEWVPFTPRGGRRGEEGDAEGMARISPLLCDGCNQCPPLCKFQAILERNHERSEGRRFLAGVGGQGPCSPPRSFATRSSSPGST